MRDFKPLNLIPWQKEVEKALHAGARRVFIKAGRKSGKSEYAKFRMVKNALNPAVTSSQVNPYITRSRIQAKNIMWDRIKKYVTKDMVEGRFKEVELVFTMAATGIPIKFFGAEDEDSMRGLEFGDYVLDEADYLKRRIFHEVIEPNTAATRPTGIFISSPAGGWFTKMWKDARDGRLGRDCAAFHKTIYDNPFINRSYIDEIKRHCSTEVWEQEYMANENAYCGLQYAEFENSHIVPHREPKGNRLARFLDWGWDHPSHVLWAEIYHNPETMRWNVYVYRELSMTGKCVQDLSTAILAGDDRQYIFSVIDIAARRHEMGTGATIIGEFRRCGVPCLTPGAKDGLRVNALKMMLKNGDIQISESCPTLIRQLKEVEWNGTNRQEDDAADALKYGASMVYNRDFATIEPGSSDIQEEKIDPCGLLANRNDDSMIWDLVSGY